VKKKIYISIALIILIFIIIGYSIKSPSKVVATYFQNIKSGTSNSVTLSMFSSIDNLNGNSDTKEISDLLINLLSKLDIDVLDESINEDTATVTVTAKGVSLYTSLNEVYTKLKTKECLEIINTLSEDELDNYFTALLLEALNNAQIEERTVNLDLIKVNNKWQLDENDEVIQEFFLGITDKNLSEMGL